MNPFPPALHVSAAYVALFADRDLGAQVLAALRAPNPTLGIARLWSAIRTDLKQLPLGCPEALTLAAVAEVIFYLQNNLNIHPRDAAPVVGTVVKILRPLPEPPPGHLWARFGVGYAWHLRHINDVPYGLEEEPTLRLAAVYEHAAGFDVVGCDRTFTTYAEAATVSEVIAVIAPTGLTKGLRAAMSRNRDGVIGAEQALDLAERLSAAVEGL